MDENGRSDRNWNETNVWCHCDESAKMFCMNVTHHISHKNRLIHLKWIEKKTSKQASTPLTMKLKIVKILPFFLNDEEKIVIFFSFQKISIIIIMIMIMLTKNQNVCNDHHDHYAKPYLVHPSIEPTVLSSCSDFFFRQRFMAFQKTLALHSDYFFFHFVFFFDINQNHHRTSHICFWPKKKYILHTIQMEKFAWNDYVISKKINDRITELSSS